MPPRIRRSRALWDETRRPDAPWTATARAILYELQPVRFSAIDASGTVASIRGIAAGSWRILQATPGVVWGIVRIIAGWRMREWTIVGGAAAYYYAVRYIHRALEAGPLVVILTAIVGIFTIGLGDEGNADGLSAYSVFNRGYQRLLGSVDVEALVQQYAGGAMAVHAQGMDDHRRNDIEDEDDDFGR
mmetsp:Transcript_15664/g.31648  ORF Transcript_15664/g.31648 Transcript_15664/m.31648 type:complete len:188 (-) Transcript_15664:112-675(-)|eukprot:CAMPEP_0178541524 /NCGR_PEP_ID=MMETSP0697-20121206/1586_1 /TAXON_ID=265572 /ORGANISM="Extubocellulus spinifer, Strain CCMP396" /LENGTH=187 /DNA_ID=CAMNT_0020173893 /DNA_START=261 /DNA_END=824 /DNA_ORIENTATION=+